MLSDHRLSFVTAIEQDVPSELSAHLHCKMGSSLAATKNRSPCLISFLFLVWTPAEVRGFVPGSWRGGGAFLSPSQQWPRPEPSTTTSTKTTTTTQRHYVDSGSETHDDMRQLYRTVAEQDPEWFQKFVIELLGEDDDILDDELIALTQRRQLRQPHESQKTETMADDESPSVASRNIDAEENLKAGGAGQHLQEDKVVAEESETDKSKSLIEDEQQSKEEAMAAVDQALSNNNTAVNTTTSTQQTVDNDAETDAETLRTRRRGTSPLSSSLSSNDITTHINSKKDNDGENAKQTEIKEAVSINITSTAEFPAETSQEAKTRDSDTAFPKESTGDDTLMVENNIDDKPQTSNAALKLPENAAVEVFSASKNTTTENNSPAVAGDFNDRMEKAFDPQTEAKTADILASQQKISSKAAFVTANDKSYETMKERSTSSTANTTDATGDNNDDRIVLFQNAFGRGWKRLPLSTLLELGYKAGEITALQPDALNLIVQDGIRKPRSGVPSRWTTAEHKNIGSKDAAVKIIAASELETKPEKSDQTSVASTGISSTVNKGEQSTPPGTKHRKKATMEQKPPESPLETEQRTNPTIPSGAATQGASKAAPTEPRRSSPASDHSSEQPGESLGDDRVRAERAAATSRSTSSTAKTSERTKPKPQILKQPRHDSSSARQRQSRPSELDEEIVEKNSVTKQRAKKPRSQAEPPRPSVERPPRERRRTPRAIDSQKTVYSVRPGPSSKRSRKIERDDPPVSSRLWPDMKTFRNLLRNEAELRLKILGEDWTDAVKEEADWRHDLYKNWLWTLHRGVGEPFVESRSDRSRRRRSPPPGSHSPRESTIGAPPSKSRKRVRER